MYRRTTLVPTSLMVHREGAKITVTMLQFPNIFCFGSKLASTSMLLSRKQHWRWQALRSKLTYETSALGQDLVRRMPMQEDFFNQLERKRHWMAMTSLLFYIFEQFSGIDFVVLSRSQLSFLKAGSCRLQLSLGRVLNVRAAKLWQSFCSCRYATSQYNPSLFIFWFAQTEWPLPPWQLPPLIFSHANEIHFVPCVPWPNELLL